MGNTLIIGFIAGLLTGLSLLSMGITFYVLRKINLDILEIQPEIKKPQTVLRSKAFSVSSKIKPIVRDDSKAMEQSAGWATPE